MNIGDVRGQVLSVNFSVYGHDVTVTPPDGEAIETRGIWVTPETTGFPIATEFQRREGTRVMALLRSACPSVPGGTVIVAPVQSGEEPTRFLVDGIEREEVEHIRVRLVAAPDEDA